MKKLIDYTETSIPRGTIFKCKGVYPYEEVVYFLLYELGDSYGLMVISGYKAGLTYVLFPKESIPEGTKNRLAKGKLAKMGLYRLPTKRCLYLREYRNFFSIIVNQNWFTNFASLHFAKV